MILRDRFKVTSNPTLKKNVLTKNLKKITSKIYAMYNLIVRGFKYNLRKTNSIKIRLTKK